MPDKETKAYLDENGDVVFDYDPHASDARRPLRPAYYSAMIEDAPIKEGPKGPYFALRLRLDPAPGEDKGRAVFENVSFAAPFRISQLSDAVWGKSEAGQHKLNPMELLNQQVTIFVTVGVNNKGVPRNELGRFVPRDQAHEVELGDYSEVEDGEAVVNMSAPLPARPAVPPAPLDDDGNQGWGGAPADLPFEDGEEAKELANMARTKAQASKRPAASKKAASKKASRR